MASKKDAAVKAGKIAWDNAEEIANLLDTLIDIHRKVTQDKSNVSQVSNPDEEIEGIRQIEGEERKEIEYEEEAQVDLEEAIENVQTILEAVNEDETLSNQELQKIENYLSIINNNLDEETAEDFIEMAKDVANRIHDDIQLEEMGVETLLRLVNSTKKLAELEGATVEDERDEERLMEEIAENKEQKRKYIEIFEDVENQDIEELRKELDRLLEEEEELFNELDEFHAEIGAAIDETTELREQVDKFIRRTESESSNNAHIEDLVETAVKISDKTDDWINKLEGLEKQIVNARSELQEAENETESAKKAIG